MSTEYHVVDHHHDPASNVYRVVVGAPEEITRPATDHEGNPILEPAPLLDEHGEPMQDVDGRDVILPGRPKLETVTHYPATEDFVFADDDERWQGKSEEEIAQAQRAEVRKALDEREQMRIEAEQRVAERRKLPGTGEAL